MLQYYGLKQKIREYGVKIMGKKVLIIMMCMLFIMRLTCIAETSKEYNTECGFVIDFNGETTDYSSIIYNNTHYVPMRIVFEKMGAYVFYRNRDSQILALLRNGDMIRHIIGDNIITINGEQKVVKTPSILENGETYIPIDMVSVCFYPDKISYINQHLDIQKQLITNDYSRVVQDVLDVCRSSNFYPEKFQRYINYHVKMPSYSMEDVIFHVNLGLDYPFYENVTTIGYPNELLVLVNKHYQLPAVFEQYNLVNMNSEFIANDGKEYLLEGGAYEKYVQMWNAAKKDGFSIKVISAYRTENYQRNLYNNKVKTTGKINADNYSARPGFSEHQTGLAIDIISTKSTFEYTDEFKWLQQHAYEYGYILRYPKGKEWITGYLYEPWHYRYVGVDAAKIIYEEDITYEEYYAKYVFVNEFR